MTTLKQATLTLTDAIIDSLGKSDIRGCNDSGYEYDYHSKYLVRYNDHWWLVQPKKEGYLTSGDVGILYPYKVD